MEQKPESEQVTTSETEAVFWISIDTKFPWDAEAGPWDCLAVMEETPLGQRGAWSRAVHYSYKIADLSLSAS